MRILHFLKMFLIKLCRQYVFAYVLPISLHIFSYILVYMFCTFICIFICRLDTEQAKEKRTEYVKQGIHNMQNMAVPDSAYCNMQTLQTLHMLLFFTFISTF